MNTRVESREARVGHTLPSTMGAAEVTPLEYYHQLKRKFTARTAATMVLLRYTSTAVDFGRRAQRMKAVLEKIEQGRRAA